jgi:hydrogenase expression/formation protein HypE
MHERTERITLDHGSGGRLTWKLLEEHVWPRFRNPILEEWDDAAALEVDADRIAFSTDGYTVFPLFFPGGDIGKLAVTGTVNDVAMKGGVPLYMSVALILEEGLPMGTLDRVLDSVQKAAREAGVTVAAGDTKVVQKGACDGIYITTTGVGRIPEGIHVSARAARPGDRLLLSGSVGDHGVAILGAREELAFTRSMESDCAAVHEMTAALIESFGSSVHTLRDPTRGGLASALNEIARASNVGLSVREERIPVKKQVASACDLLGYDPLHLACEGRFVACLDASCAQEALERVREFPEGRGAELVGEVRREDSGRVVLVTSIGGTRVLDMPVGEPVPRIC